MAIFDTSGGQFTAVTGRKRRFPYAAFIESQIPSLYQSRQRQQDKEFAESQLSLEEQALEESSRASEASLAESSRASSAALDESIRTSGIQAGLRREEISAQEKQAQTGALISGAQTAGLGYYGASKLGLFGGKTAAAQQAVTAGIPASGAGVPASTAPGGVGALGIAGGIAAGATLDDYLSRRVAGTLDDPAASFQQKTRGLTRYGGSSPLTTALIEKGLGKSGRDVVDKITDPTGLLGKVEDKVGSTVSATIPKFLGGGGSTGSKTVDTILNPLGTWICTKTKETVGMTGKEWYAITKLKRHSLSNHNDWMETYMKIGPELIDSMNGDTAFYENLKATFILPIVGLIAGGYVEAAYLSYKSVVLQLIDKYNPGLAEQYPKGGE